MIVKLLISQSVGSSAIHLRTQKGFIAPPPRLLALARSSVPSYCFGGPKALGSKTVWMETIFPALTSYHEHMNRVGPVVLTSYITHTSSPSAKTFLMSYFPRYVLSISMKSSGLPKVSPPG